MGTCAACGATIVFGPVRHDGRDFCNARCRDGYGAVSVLVSDAEAEAHARQIFRGKCPRCGGMGPVDVRCSYTVWSALVLTSWKTRRLVGCSSCGARARNEAIVFCAALGWWGFPFGLILTPIQLFRNIWTMAYLDGNEPSQELVEFARMELAIAGAEQQQVDQAAPPPLPISPRS